MTELDIDFLDELLEDESERTKSREHKNSYSAMVVEQIGPLRWVDRELRCAARGCSSPTYCKVKGIPYCMMHSVRELNRMLVELGVE